jgi:hypothetical protein
MRQRIFLSVVFVVPMVCGLSATAQETAKANKPLQSVRLEIHEDIPDAEVRVNGSGPLWFVVDSGASACVVDKAQGKALGISTAGRYQGTGAGAGPVDFSIVTDVRFTVAEQSFKTDKSYAIDLSGVSTPKDRKLAGLLHGRVRLPRETDDSRTESPLSEIRLRTARDGRGITINANRGRTKGIDVPLESRRSAGSGHTD